MAAALPQDLAAQLKYGPQTGGSIRRSQYLADALQQMQSGAQTIRSPGELGAKLLATAILVRAGKKADADALKSMRDQQDAETAATLAGFGLPSMTGGVQPPAMPTAPSPATGINPNAPPPAINSAAAAPAATPGMSPADRLALAQTVWGEARGEPAAGQQAVASVILNRAKASGKSPAEVVSAPHQFSGYNPRSQALTPEQLQQVVANIDPVLNGSAPDPTGGADHFYNPALASPSWGQGTGQMIGQHKFMRLNDQGHALQASISPAQAQAEARAEGAAHQLPPGAVMGGGNPAHPPVAPQLPGGGSLAYTPPPAGVQMTAGPPPQAPLQVSPTMAAAQAPPPPVDPSAQPFQVAANQLQPGMVPGQPSAPGSSPPDAGTPPAASLPQASAAAGGTPGGLSITPAQLSIVERLLRDPRTHEVGLQYAMELQKKAAEPTKYDIQMVNGVPAWADPYHPGQIQTGAVPKEAMTQVLSAADAGISAPPGTSFSRDPNGNVKQVYQPQNGQQTVSALNAPYREAPIQGGTNDPLAPAAKFSNEGKLRDDYAKEIAPYVAAREGYQKVISAAGDHTQAGAIAMVFGVMKTLDPSSTVREGEQAQVQNSGTIPQSITNLYNKLLGGTGSLDDAQRAQFANMAQHQFGVYQKTFDAANQRYGGLAQSYGMDPRNVVRSFDPIEPYHPPAQQGGGVPAAARNAYVGLYQQGKIDTTKPDGHPLHPMIAATPEILQGMDTPANRGKHVITPDGHLAVIE